MGRLTYICLALGMALPCLTGCGGRGGTTRRAADTLALAPCPAFCADSAFRFVEEQCAFGPRVTGTRESRECAGYIAGRFRGYGAVVETRPCTVTTWDGSKVEALNIVASINPDSRDRILLCAHWDSRPWADNDPDEANWRKPVMAANDGASGVAVMLEIARLLNSGAADSLALGVDFVCFDAEDWGVPQWSDAQQADDSWALGAQHWAARPHKDGYEARFGILLDMVGGADAKFYREQVSTHFAPAIVDKVWAAAEAAGFGSYFPNEEGGMINDDHVPVNRIAGIPTIDIIAHYPDCEQSSFGPTWHTVSDDMDHIDRNVLRAVGQTVIQVLFSEK